jgi:hypothetical protein
LDIVQEFKNQPLSLTIAINSRLTYNYAIPKNSRINWPWITGPKKLHDKAKTCGANRALRALRRLALWGLSFFVDNAT